MDTSTIDEAVSMDSRAWSICCCHGHCSPDMVFVCVMELLVTGISIPSFSLYYLISYAHLLALLPRLPAFDPNLDHDPFLADVCDWGIMQCARCGRCSSYFCSIHPR